MKNSAELQKLRPLFTLQSILKQDPMYNSTTICLLNEVCVHELHNSEQVPYKFLPVSVAHFVFPISQPPQTRHIITADTGTDMSILELLIPVFRPHIYVPKKSFTTYIPHDDSSFSQSLMIFDRDVRNWQSSSLMQCIWFQIEAFWTPKLHHTVSQRIVLKSVYNDGSLKSKGSKLTAASSLNHLLHTNHSTASAHSLLILLQQNLQQPAVKENALLSFQSGCLQYLLGCQMPTINPI